MESMRLELITPEGVIFDGDILTVTLPGSEGEFGVLKDHAGTVTTLKAGVIEIEKPDKSKELVAVDWGTVKVDEDKVTILADGAVAIEGANISEAIKKAKELIASMSDSDIAIATATSKLESAAKGL